MGHWQFRWAATDANNDSIPGESEKQYSDTSVVQERLYLAFYSSGICVASYQDGAVPVYDTAHWALLSADQLQLTNGGTSGVVTIYALNDTSLVIRHKETVDPDDADWSGYQRD